jgi:uncharacterized protein YheU (UPF0270 family)
MKPLVIPHEELNPDTLRAMLEDFVTRDGTEYGENETPIAERIDFVLRQLRAGKAFILYDAESASFTIGSREQMTAQDTLGMDTRSASRAIDD